MNAKDLNMLAHLRALADAGVDSIKIEGRNKKAFYVATVVGAYRRVLDGEPPEAVADELLAVSHRPYGTGFYFSEAEQATAYDGYEQETMHVADVVASSPRPPERSVQREVEVEGFPDDPQYLYLLCRNRFAEGDELETLVPHEPSRRLIVRDLHWLNTFGPDNHDEDAPATVGEALISCYCHRLGTRRRGQPLLQPLPYPRRRCLALCLRRFGFCRAFRLRQGGMR